MTRIEAELRIPEADEPIRSGGVVVDGPTTRCAGPTGGAPPPDSSEVTLSVPEVMPDLRDCHTHFVGLRNASIGKDGKLVVDRTSST